MIGPKVRLVFRKPTGTTYSIEFLFHEICREISRVYTGIEIEEVELPAFSKGFCNRFRNITSLIKFKDGITHITGDSYYAILGALFSKRVITIHDLHFLNRTKGCKRQVLKLFWLTLPTRFSHKITVVSKATLEAILQETDIPEHKIQVIYNFIDPIFQPVIREFNQHVPRILQIGANFNKNLSNLSKALQGLPCTLVIIGRLSEQQKRELAASNVQYENKTGLSTEQLYQEYRRADLLTFVSTVEGFGLPILEAQATGLPVVTSNCSSMPEVAGKGAVFVEPHSPVDIRNGITEVIQNYQRRGEIIKEGFANAARFSKEKVAAAYVDLYKQLLN